jgi:molybdopterin-guanine dinucleotide biosynthesis protein A
MKVLGVILAGGLARRMGGSAEAPGDKAMIVLGGQTLLQRAVSRLEPQVDDLVVNANGDPARFLGMGRRPVIADADDSRAGPLAGVLAGLDHAAGQGASHIVTAAVDTPFFPLDLVARLREAATAEGVPLACAKTGERTHPVFGLWPVDLADDLRAAMADGLRKVDRWTAPHGCAEAVFAADPVDPFFNINTPVDLAEAERLLEP